MAFPTVNAGDEFASSEFQRRYASSRVDRQWAAAYASFDSGGDPGSLDRPTAESLVGDVAQLSWWEPANMIGLIWAIPSAASSSIPVGFRSSGVLADYCYSDSTEVYAEAMSGSPGTRYREKEFQSVALTVIRQMNSWTSDTITPTEGDLARNLSDGKIYRWTSGAFVLAPGERADIMAIEGEPLIGDIIAPALFERQSSLFTSSKVVVGVAISAALASTSGSPVGSVYDIAGSIDRETRPLADFVSPEVGLLFPNTFAVGPGFANSSGAGAYAIAQGVVPSSGTTTSVSRLASGASVGGAYYANIIHGTSFSHADLVDNFMDPDAPSGGGGTQIGVTAGYAFRAALGDHTIVFGNVGGSTLPMSRRMEIFCATLPLSGGLQTGSFAYPSTPGYFDIVASITTTTDSATVVSPTIGQVVLTDFPPAPHVTEPADVTGALSDTVQWGFSPDWLVGFMWWDVDGGFEF